MSEVLAFCTRKRRDDLALCLDALADCAGGHITHRTATTPGQKNILNALELPEPPRFLDLTPTTEH